MLKTFSTVDLPDPIPREAETSLLQALSARLASSIRAGASQDENVDSLNLGIREVFRQHGLDCVYIGPYGIIPGKSEVTNPLVASIGHGCTDISVFRGAISTVFRLYGEQSLYIPSVHDLERQAPNAHHECRKGSDMPDMAEIIIALSKVYDGKSVAQECLDLDIARSNPFSEKGVAELEEIIVPHLRTIFPGEISYVPIPGVHIRPN